jgi:hypothetical protein
VADAPTSVTPAQVRNLSIAGLFAAISDTVMNEYIRVASNLLGSAYARSHQQREDGVVALTAHLLWLQLKAEGALGGGGGGGGNGPGVFSSLSLVGVGSMSFAVTAQTVDQLNDWLQTWSPFSIRMHAIIDSFGPAMFVVGMDGTEVYS